MLKMFNLIWANETYEDCPHCKGDITEDEEGDKFQFINSYVLDESDFSLLKEECHKFDSELNNSFQKLLPAASRFNFSLPRTSKVYDILEKNLPTFRESIKNDKVNLAKDIPVDYRKYVPGSFMTWHIDYPIYTQPHYECVLTLENNSDGFTLFLGNRGVFSVEHVPNSFLSIKSNSIQNSDQEVTQGERLFIKFILTETEDKIE